jgi:hypothetical protein
MIVLAVDRGQRDAGLGLGVRNHEHRDRACPDLPVDRLVRSAVSGQRDAWRLLATQLGSRRPPGSRSHHELAASGLDQLLAARMAERVDQLSEGGDARGSHRFASNAQFRGNRHLRFGSTMRISRNHAVASEVPVGPPGFEASCKSEVPLGWCEDR